MAVLTNFTFSPNGLSVQFTDLSTGGPLIWEWDFGDGSAVSSEQNPGHSYSQNGFYLVTLKAKALVGDAWVEHTMNIGVSSFGSALPDSIYNLIDYRLPVGLTLPTDKKSYYIQQWQIYIQPLVVPEVVEANTYNEFAYVPLANTLITYLVALDLIIAGANAYLMSLGGDTTEGGRKVKKITTGPADAEWFAGSEEWSNVMKAGGVYQQLQQQCCTIAARIRIQLAFCPLLPHTTIPPTIARPTAKKVSSYYNPFKPPSVG